MSAPLRSAGWYASSLAITVVMLFPVYWMFNVSLKTPREIFKYPPVWYPHTPQFSESRSVSSHWSAIACRSASRSSSHRSRSSTTSARSS